MAASIDQCHGFKWTVTYDGKGALTDASELATVRASELLAQQTRKYKVVWTHLTNAEMQTLRDAFLEVGTSGALRWTAPDESEAKAYRFNKFVETVNSITDFNCEAELVYLPAVKVPY